MTSNVGPREQMFRIGTGSAAVTAALCLPRLGGWRWLLGAWGLANIATAVTRYCPSNALFGIDNTRGSEFMHFDESLPDFRGRAGRRLNRWEHRLGATFDRPVPHPAGQEEREGTQPVQEGASALGPRRLAAQS